MTASTTHPKVALITGASRGIGAACARRLAEDGFAVAVNTHRDARMRDAAERLVSELLATGQQAAVYEADVSDAADVDEMFAACEKQLGVVSALVLNAAAREQKPWVELTESEWHYVLDVNLKGAFLCTRRAFGAGSVTDAAIVTVGSVQSEIGVAGGLPYATSKAGIIGFTRSLARELGPRGIRINCVMPGAIQTEDELERFPDRDEVERFAAAVQCLQRRGIAEDIASVVSFLVSSDSSFMTGQTVCVDGGWVFR